MQIRLIVRSLHLDDRTQSQYADFAIQRLGEQSGIVDYFVCQSQVSLLLNDFENSLWISHYPLQDDVDEPCFCNLKAALFIVIENSFYGVIHFDNV